MNNQKQKNPFYQSEVAETYDEFYNNPVGKMIDKLEKQAIISLIPKSFKEKRDLNILEIGAGTGHWTEFFAQFTTGSNGIIIGVEPSKAMLEQALNKHIKNADFVNTDALNFKSTTKFDIIAFITSLEFIDNPVEVLRHILQFIKPSGILILGVLNAESSFMQSLKKSSEIYKNAHFYSENELRELLKEFADTMNISIRHSTFFLPDQSDQLAKAEEIEKKALSDNLKNGAFIAACVSNIHLDAGFKETVNKR